jgi:polar amino acid transport system permease protein
MDWISYWNFGSVLPYLPYLLAGARMTVLISIISLVLAMSIGLLLALARLSSMLPLRAAAALFIDIWRSTPTLAQLLWVYYALPILTGVPMTAYVAGTIALACHYGSNLAEVYRAGILAVPLGQTHAGLAIGLTRAQTMRRIVLPQATEIMLPPIASQFIILFKESALLSMISVEELMWHGQSLAGLTMRSVEVFTAVAVIYMAMTYPQTLLVNWLHRRRVHGAS